MSRRSVVSMLGAAALLAASVAGASSASALPLDATAPSSQSFGEVAVYGTAERTITVTATGGPVTFGGAPTIEPFNGALDQAADYSVLSETCSDTTVLAEQTCSVTVSFNPFAAGQRQATLSVVATSPASVVTVALTGIGVPNATGTYYGLEQPQRALDTRGAAGTSPPVAAEGIVSVQVANQFGIPATGVSAVVINLTAVRSASAGYLTAYPSLTPRPTETSSINFPKGATIANMVTVPVGADGKVSVYNNGGNVHILVDVMGWYAKDDSVRTAPIDKGMGSQFLSPGDPERMYNSIQDPLNSNLPFFGGDWIEFEDTWDAEAAATSVKAYAVTITAFRANASGHMTAWAGGDAPMPAVSNVNFQKGVAAPNMAIVPAGHYTPTSTGFRIEVAGTGTVHLIVDLLGYYVTDDSQGLRFKPLAGSSPQRILDTRKALGATAGKIGANASRQAVASVAGPDSIFVVGNTTGVLPSAQTYLTVWSGATTTPPGASTLNLVAGVNRAVSTYAPLSFGAGGAASYRIYNNAGSTHVLFDAAGTLDVYPGQTVIPTPAVTGKVTGDAATADRTVGGRTIPGASTFATGHESTTTRRG